MRAVNGIDKSGPVGPAVAPLKFAGIRDAVVVSLVHDLEKNFEENNVYCQDSWA